MTAKALRFAMVTTFYPPYNFGGDGQFVRRLAHALAGRGHEVDIIHDVDAYAMLSDGALGDLEPEPEPEGVRVHSLKSSLGALSCLATQQLGRPLIHGAEIKRILAQGFDVIHFHNISLVGGPKILGLGDGIKLYTTHEHWLVCPSHILWRHNREICTGRECLRCVIKHRRLPQAWRASSLLKRESTHVDAFVTLSRFCADKHKEFGFERPMTIMPSFLPDAECGPDPLEAEDKEQKPYFLFVGRLEIIKGLQDVIPLFGDDAPAELWIAGSGGYEQTLRDLAGGSRKVRFLGQTAPEKLRALYKNAIAAITPSKCFEVFPMVVLEAFREGTPIVARRLGPYPEIVDQSGGGLLFETREDLKAAIGTLAGDRGVRDKMGQAGARAMQARWSEGVALERYFSLIHDIAETRRMPHVLDKFQAGEEGQTIGLELE